MTTEEPHKLKVKFEEQDLLCINKCGFFGNPEWEGYCSKCYRDVQHVSKRALHYNKNRTILKFDKFEEKRKQQTDRRSSTLKSALFGKSPKQHSDSSPAIRPAHHQPHRRSRTLSPESHAVREKFLVYLQKLPRPVAHELSKILTGAVEKISYEFNGNRIDELSEMIQDLYQHVQDKLTKEQDNLPLTVDDIMNYVEQYICVRVFHSLFCANTDEEVSDLSLQDRIRSLHWVTSGFLETSLDFTEPGVRDQVDHAITEMIDMNSYREIDAKLASLVRCCNGIFDALKLSKKGAPASADDFLPVLIYVILKCNPPLLQSNLKYISRFALPSKVDTGETGYYFTNLCCAVKFVQNLNADSLTMPREEFEAYTSGQLIPPATEENTRCHELIKVMENNIVRLDQLHDRQKELASKIQEFQEYTIRETDLIINRLRECQRAYPPPPDFETWERQMTAIVDAKFDAQHRLRDERKSLETATAVCEERNSVESQSETSNSKH